MSAGTFFLLYSLFLSLGPRIVLAQQAFNKYFCITAYVEASGKNTDLFCKKFREFEVNILGLSFICYFRYIWCNSVSYLKVQLLKCQLISLLKIIKMDFQPSIYFGAKCDINGHILRYTKQLHLYGQDGCNVLKHDNYNILKFKY